MTVKYHNTPKGPRLCKASVRECKYALAGADHYSSQEEANAAYVEKMTQVFGVLPRPHRVEREIQQFYRDIDTVRFGFSRVRENSILLKVNTLSALRNASQSARSSRSTLRRKLLAYAVQEQQRQSEQRKVSGESPRAGFEGSRFVFGERKMAFTDGEGPRVLIVTERQMKSMQRFLNPDLKQQDKQEESAPMASRETPITQPLPRISPAPSPQASQKRSPGLPRPRTSGSASSSSQARRGAYSGPQGARRPGQTGSIVGNSPYRAPRSQISRPSLKSKSFAGNLLLGLFGMLRASSSEHRQASALRGQREMAGHAR